MYVLCVFLLNAQRLLLFLFTFMPHIHFACHHLFEVPLPPILASRPHVPAETRLIPLIVAAVFIAPIIAHPLAETFAINAVPRSWRDTNEETVRTRVGRPTLEHGVTGLKHKK
jgi:hypothetical protein